MSDCETSLVVSYNFISPHIFFQAGEPEKKCNEQRCGTQQRQYCWRFEQPVERARQVASRNSARRRRCIGSVLAVPEREDIFY